MPPTPRLVPSSPRSSPTGQTSLSTSQASDPDHRLVWADSSPCPEFFVRPEFLLSSGRSQTSTLSTSSSPTGQTTLSTSQVPRLLVSISSSVHPVQISVFSAYLSQFYRDSALVPDNHQMSGLILPPEVSILSNQSDSPVVAALKWCHHWGVI